MDALKKFVVIAVLAGVGFYGFKAWQDRPAAPPIESDNFEGWQTVQGRVTNLEIERPGKGRPSELTIFFEYEIGGRTYQNDTFLRFPDEIGADRTMQKYPKGKWIEVSYDPRQPKRSYVIRPNSISMNR